MILALNDIPLTHDNTLLYCDDIMGNAGHYFAGVTQDIPALGQYDGLSRVDVKVGNGLQIMFPADTGYLVVLIPVGVKAFKRWYIRSNNKGYIDGNINDPYTNLFPAPDIVSHQGEYYRAYVSNYITKVTSLMSLYLE